MRDCLKPSESVLEILILAMQVVRAFRHECAQGYQKNRNCE